ncbi:MAG: hypothetical protein KDA91_13080 [Planctomycetaceae bacterium]|nr:hypothetical protein [Planctomycetaceae bacterium]
MAKSTSRKPRPSRKKDAEVTPVLPQPSSPSLLRWFFRPGTLMLTAAIASVWILAPVIVRQLPKLDARPEYRVSPGQITINPPPRWIPPDLVAQVFERAEFGDSESLLDETLSERIAAAFYTHPWIENVRTVRKSFPAHLTVELVYREPVAMVKGVDGYYPIDRNGILLPPADFSIADIERYPVIERVASVPMGKLGEPWGDPVVEGAAQLAAVLNKQEGDQPSWWKQLEVKSILVPRRVALADSADSLEYQLETVGGSHILWGRAPNTRHPGELTVEQKLQRLAEFHSDLGFDDEHGPYEIDIRPWHGIGRGRLAKEESDGRQQL